ncbi:MAG: YfcC family protein [Bacteroidales bacterium]|nr:YfcC family protein [Bacteroidales bacterium]
MLKKVPNTFVIVFFIIVFSAILTWIIPGGTFDRHSEVVNGIERTVITPNSFHSFESQPQTWEVFSALFAGFVDKADIIVFILLIGGAFWIMNQSQSIDVGIFTFLRFTSKLERFELIKTLGVNNIVLTLIMLMFSVFGATFGMSEETIAFIVVLVPLAISMGYDSITGVSIVFVAAGLGFAGAILNPFTIGIAQGLSDLPLFSGIEFRLFSWFVINLIGITFVLRYAQKVKKTPENSPVYVEDQYWRDKGKQSSDKFEFYTPISAWVSFILIFSVMLIFSINYNSTTLKIGNSGITWPILPILTGIFAIFSIISLRKSVHFFILNLLLFTILLLIVGVMGYDWYIMEIATLFFSMGIASGIAMNYSADKIVKFFLEGVSDIISAAMIVGLAGGIIIILQEGKVIDPILNSLASLMDNAGKVTSVGTMYLIQNFINIIIPSGSAKAALTMPIMAPFSDVIGVSRQATVMAYQFGDGFTNLITPTSGVLIAVLGIARIPFEKWVKWIMPLILTLIVIGFLLLIPTVTMDLNGF